MGSIVRQPILDSYGLVHGYELLINIGPQMDLESVGNENIVTLLDNIVLFGLDRLTGRLPAFFHCTAGVLTEDLLAVLPPWMTVLEITASL
jgi:c-di-GMP-related signal transduction protein